MDDSPTLLAVEDDFECGKTGVFFIYSYGAGDLSFEGSMDLGPSVAIGLLN